MPSKKTVKKEVEPEKAPAVSKNNYSLLKNKYLIIGAIIILLAVIAYMFKSLFVVAMVNGQPITRLAYMHELEKEAGKQSLNSLITQQLISQEAAKQNVSVTQPEIDTEVSGIETQLSKQNQKLDDVLTLRGLKKSDLIDQIRTEKLIQKLLGKDIKVSDSDIDDFIKNNKDSIPQGSNPDTIKASVRQQLVQEKLSQKFQSWIQEKQKNAKINYFISM